jgi:hypothetical protein
MCYNFDYPIQLIDQASGNVNNIADQQAWNDYLNSNSNNGMVLFVYPLGLVHTETGATTTVNNEVELFEAAEDCF